MNLFTVPLGGIPMCHGAGGLAAQYRFGARTGGSVIILGAIKIISGVFLGAMLFQLLQTYPMSILGPMLVMSGLELAKASRDVIGNRFGMAVVMVMALLIIVYNTAIGFLVGAGIAALQYFYLKDSGRKGGDEANGS